MSKLPRTTKPTFELYVPSIKSNVIARPFAVGEEKILLIAQESGSDKEIVLAIKQVLQNCVVTEGFDVNTLATFDLEYMFIKLRARSVNNIVEVSYRDGEDEKVYNFEVDLNEVQLITGDIQPIIMADDNIGCKMKYPSITIIDNAPEDASPAEVVEYMIRSCIDSIFDQDSVYPASDYTEEELAEWLLDLDIHVFEKIRSFFNDMPKMYYKLEYMNANGSERVIELTTLTDFFTWG